MVAAPTRRSAVGSDQLVATTAPTIAPAASQPDRGIADARSGRDGYEITHLLERGGTKDLARLQILDAREGGLLTLRDDLGRSHLAYSGE